MKVNYVSNSERTMIYQIVSSSIVPNSEDRQGYITYSLELVCGKDYPDSDIDAVVWCSREHFVSSVLYESVVQYYETESLEEALEQEGFVPISSLPRIYN